MHLADISSLRSAINTHILCLIKCVHTACPTLQTIDLDSKMFLAARSLCTNAFLERYSIPCATSLQKFISLSDHSAPIFSPGLYIDQLILCICGKNHCSILVLYVHYMRNLQWSCLKEKVPQITVRTEFKY